MALRVRSQLVPIQPIREVFMTAPEAAERQLAIGPEDNQAAASETIPKVQTSAAMEIALGRLRKWLVTAR